ncbi:TPA: helix-turn-helix domain-containing protein [Bacillus pacificus]|nr:helix-turn-helix domain-containing protein [Bacillus pacificus]
MDTKNNKSFEVTTGEPLVKGGYFVAYNYVVRHVSNVYKLTTGEFSCLMLLFSYAGSDVSKCFPSQDVLATHLNVNVRTAQRYLDGLETKGAIITYNRFNKDKFKTRNIYDLSPCVDKIRELYAPKVEEEFVLVKKEKPHNGGSDKIDVSEESTPEPELSEEKSENVDIPVVTDLSLPWDQTRQECQPIININNKPLEPLKNIKSDDDIANSVSPPENESEILQVINELREMTKDELTARSFNAVLRKVKDKHMQGKIHTSFRDYFVTSLARKIEELELRRIKENAKAALKNTRPPRTPYTGKIAFYDWLNT